MKESDYFVNNWSVLRYLMKIICGRNMIKFLVCFSGIGNILLFLTKYFQVGQVSFLRILPSEAASSGGKDKVGSCPTFIIMTEVYYEDDLLDKLLEFVQRTRVGRNTGHLGIYLRNERDTKS